MKRSTQRTWWGVRAVVVVGLGLAGACATDDSVDTTASSPPPTTTTSSISVATAATGTADIEVADDEPFTFTESCTQFDSVPDFTMYACEETSADPRFAGTTTMWYSATGVIFQLSNDGGRWLGTGTPIGDGTWTGSGIGYDGYEGFQYRYKDGPPTFTVTIERRSETEPPTFLTSEICTTSSESDYRYECENLASDDRFDGTKLLSGNDSWTQGTFKVTNDDGAWSGMWRLDAGRVDAIGVGTGDYAGLSVRFEGPPPSFTSVIEPIGYYFGDDPAADLLGTWITGGGVYMTYEDDGTWTIAVAPDSAPFAWGTYTFDGRRLTYTDIEGGAKCPDSETGSYDATFTSSGDLSLTLIDDDCDIRASDAESPSVRYSP